MSVRLRSAVLLICCGCAQSSGEPLSRLTQAWAVDTADQAVTSVTGTLVLSALAAHICARRNGTDVDALAAGEAFPIPDSLVAIMGSPVVHSVEPAEGEWSQAVLENIRLAGRSGEWLRVLLTETEEQLSVEFAPLVDDEGADGEPARMAGFGQISITVEPDCTSERSVVSGKALWIDEDDRRHEVTMPADQELGSELVLSGDVPWLPLSGAINWEARIDKQRRSLTSEDATELRLTDGGVARWPVGVYGPDWSGTAIMTIAP